MKRPYESMVVFDGTLPEDVLQKEQKQVEELIAKHAEFEKTDVWGKKQLFGKKYLGLVRTTFIIDEQGTIQHIIRAVKSASHAQQIRNL